MSIGWFVDLNDAKDYFIDERLVETAWNALATDALKTKAVINAYNRIFYNPKYDVPTYAVATPAQKVVLRKINGEMAYYLAQHMEDEDRRMGLRAQGVTKAGIVKEEYKEDVELPVPPLVEDMLDEEDFIAVEKAFDMIDVDRDEDESVDTKVDDF